MTVSVLPARYTCRSAAGRVPLPLSGGQDNPDLLRQGAFRSQQGHCLAAMRQQAKRAIGVFHERRQGLDPVPIVRIYQSTTRHQSRAADAPRPCST